MILVTTELSEKSLKTVAMVTKILPLIPSLRSYTLEKNSKKLGTQDLSKFQNEKEMDVKSTSLLHLG